MLKFLMMVLAVATSVSQAAPKVYSNAEVLAHVLSSKKFTKYVLAHKELTEGQLNKVTIAFKEVREDLKEGEVADGNYFQADFVYRVPQHGGAPDQPCSFSAKVLVEYENKEVKVNGGTVFVTESKLVAPSFGIVACRQ